MMMRTSQWRYTFANNPDVNRQDGARKSKENRRNVAKILCFVEGKKRDRRKTVLRNLFVCIEIGKPRLLSLSHYFLAKDSK